jgi:O-acetyl-ADP-ribose deacetylase (regulator of RNase III)
MGVVSMIYVKGDLLELADKGEFDVIVHGCNCFNTMKSGIAGAIAKRYSTTIMVDHQTINGDYEKLGTWTECFGLTSTMPVARFRIINAYTQYNYSRNKDVFEYLAFELILQKLAYMYPKERFGFPLIGCGLAGGDKPRIMNLIEHNLASKIDGTVTIVEWDK